MSSDMSAFLITAFLSDMVLLSSQTIATRLKSFCHGAKRQSPLAFQLSVRNYMHYFWAKYNNWLFNANTVQPVLRFLLRSIKAAVHLADVQAITSADAASVAFCISPELLCAV